MIEQAYPDYNADMEDLRTALRVANERIAETEAQVNAQRAEIDALSGLRTERRALLDLLSADKSMVAGQTLVEALQTIMGDRSAMHTLLRDARIYVDRMTIQVGPVAHDGLWQARQLLLRIDAALRTDGAAGEG